ncbi:tRNA pseudouridine(55) synthase TruB [Nocardioides terrisoli]|uniref:tRNA pseudouridine(55) synthase TruB n=1 Tax=Nocardioides terrisoli TaxID=3388267 RepID=UPI00287B6586|nr:tRNA pseudouridine(55) synthase TruB [Nocardioides marmorisolisilvae]
MTEPTPGLVIVDKPAGLTSHDVVSRVRRLAGTRKVGHAGTLDPMATGVLVVGIGRATRLLGHLLVTDKAYDATVVLGAATSTDDAEGEVLRRCDPSAVTVAAVADGVAAMVGDIDQVPSSVSAIKVDGRRAYDRVRAGERVDLPARRVRIDAIDITRIELPEVDLTVRCSSGTYVRAIARDLGDTLGVGGHLTALRRTAVGPFTLADAHTLEELAESFALLPIADVARRCFRTVAVDAAQAVAVGFGRRLDLRLPEPGPVALFGPDGAFLALYEERDGQAVAVAVFC